jgi:hypothetical protein
VGKEFITRSFLAAVCWWSILVQLAISLPSKFACIWYSNQWY